jgi:hypothetical protein
VSRWMDIAGPFSLWNIAGVSRWVDVADPFSL